MRIDVLDRKQTVPCRASWIPAVVLIMFAASVVPTVRAQDNIGGHVGFVLPLVTHAGGKTTNLADNFAIGFPLGVTFKGQGRMSFDLELVPAIQNSPRQVNLTVHPGLLFGLGHNWTAGMRMAFDINSSQFGFTPLVNKSWPIKSKNSFFKAYFVEAVLPVRFNRPTGGPSRPLSSRTRGPPAPRSARRRPRAP